MGRGAETRAIPLYFRQEQPSMQIRVIEHTRPGAPSHTLMGMTRIYMR